MSEKISEISKRPLAEKEEPPGIKAEKIVAEFLKNIFSFCTKIERTSRFDQNDKNGIDFVFEINNEYKLAVDITFNNDKMLKEKMKRNLRNPLVYLHNNQGKAIGQLLPRLLIRGQSIAFWFFHANEAERRGAKLVDIMPENEKNRQKKIFLEQILDQIVGLSQRDQQYAKKIKPVRKIFEEEKEKLKN